MMEYISTVIIAGLLALVVFLIIKSMRKQKKAGRSPTCSCGCQGCAMQGMCHKEEKNKE